LTFFAMNKEATIDKARSFPCDAKTPYQRDFEQGKNREIETFAGYIVGESRRLGLAAPAHEEVYAGPSRPARYDFFVDKIMLQG
jgi:ketopantoate reductase